MVAVSRRAGSLRRWSWLATLVLAVSPVALTSADDGGKAISAISPGVLPVAIWDLMPEDVEWSQGQLLRAGDEALKHCHVQPIQDAAKEWGKALKGSADKVDFCGRLTFISDEDHRLSVTALDFAVVSSGRAMLLRERGLYSAPVNKSVSTVDLAARRVPLVREMKRTDFDFGAAGGFDASLSAVDGGLVVIEVMSAGLHRWSVGSSASPSFFRRMQRLGTKDGIEVRGPLTIWTSARMYRPLSIDLVGLPNLGGHPRGEGEKFGVGWP